MGEKIIRKGAALGPTEFNVTADYHSVNIPVGYGLNALLLKLRKQRLSQPVVYSTRQYGETTMVYKNSRLIGWYESADAVLGSQFTHITGRTKFYYDFNEGFKEMFL